ncbi:MAG: orotate phosphoribosyltransferase [Salinivirgaceae bacterium]|nr:orotate phosphoribosyltransferase [Salinivirgaceae bacterium]MDD4746180.1 orotate phosphoribosyltransferase [Salinivirgaceae bacterium]MDY0281743.1 orotate phosphoribosyltransferase [Salinivirgaceae bacterium]
MHDSTIFDQQLAGKLLQINAIKLNATNYFTWASGIKSPIYCDNRQTLAFPEVRKLICEGFCSVISKLYPNVDYVAGVATGAIAHGMLVADQLELPYIYVRPKPKDHGMSNQIEGVIDPGKSVVVIEDLISTGGSSLKAVEALRKAGYNVLGLVAIFSYGFRVAQEAFEDAECSYTTLTNYETLIKEGLNQDYIKSNQVAELSAWRSSINQESKK